MHNTEENYSLTVNKVNPETGTSEQHSYSATSPEEMAYMLKLAGVLPVNQEDEVTVQEPIASPEPIDPEASNQYMFSPDDFSDLSGSSDSEDEVEEPMVPEYPEVADVHSCGCVGDCGCGQNTPELPYDNDTFSPEADMNNWQARSFETLVNTPSDQWPELVEQFKLELQRKGLTEEEAEERVLKLMDMDIVEGYDYGHHDYGHRDYMDGHHIARIRGSTIDKAKWNRMDQNYVKAGNSDNPLDPRGMIEGKDFFAMYNEYLESLKDKGDE